MMTRMSQADKRIRINAFMPFIKLSLNSTLVLSLVLSLILSLDGKSSWIKAGLLAVRVMVGVAKGAWFP